MHGRHRPRANQRLTDRQQEALDLLKALWRELGKGPTLREFAERYHTGIQPAHTVLEVLVRKGRVERTASYDRSYQPKGCTGFCGYVESHTAPDGFVVAVLYGDPAQAAVAAEQVRMRATLYARALGEVSRGV